MTVPSKIYETYISLRHLCNDKANLADEGLTGKIVGSTPRVVARVESTCERTTWTIRTRGSGSFDSVRGLLRRDNLPRGANRTKDQTRTLHRIDREANKPDLLTLLPNLSTTTNEFTNQKEHFTKAVTMASTSIAAEPAQDVPIFLRSKSQSCAPRPVGGLRVPHVGRENVPFAKMLCHRRMRSFHHDGLF
jgi:hypothetical protein